MPGRVLLSTGGRALISADGSKILLAVNGVEPYGIPATAAFGQPTLTPVIPPAWIQVSGFGPTAAVGQPSISSASQGPYVRPTGLGPTVAMGAPQLGLAPATYVQPTGFGPTAAMGAPTITIAGSTGYIQPAGIGPMVAVGQPTLSVSQNSGYKIQPTGIGPTVAMGSPALSGQSASSTPTWTSVTPWVAPQNTGTIITLIGSGLTGGVVTSAGGGTFATTVVSDTKITFVFPAGGGNFYPNACFVQTPTGTSPRFGVIVGQSGNVSCVDLLLPTYVAGQPMTVYGYGSPFPGPVAFQIQNYADNSLVASYTTTMSAANGSWSLTITAPPIGQYFIHSNTSVGGSDFWTGSFQTASSLTAPIILGIQPAVQVPGLSVPVVLAGGGFTSVTSVKFGGVAQTFSVVNDTQINVTVASQPYGLVDVLLTNSHGETALLSAGFRFLHAIVEPIPQPGPNNTAPTVPSRWKGPWAAVNPVKSGQVTSIIVDPVHGNGNGTGSDGVTNNLWNNFDFLHQNFGPSQAYPMLADGGTIHVRAGSFTAGPWAETWLADFPGGINIIGVGADQATLLNFGTGPSGDKAMTIWRTNVYIYGMNFEMGGADEPTSGYGAVRLYNDVRVGTGDGSSAIAHYAHVEKCRFNQCEEAIVGDTAGTPTGENRNLYIKDCDFSLLIPDAYNSDWLSHEVYCGSQQFWETCNAYGCKNGSVHKGRAPSMTIVNCWTRRTPNRWVDYPEGGQFQAFNSTFTEALQAGDPTSDTDLHCFEYCSTIPNINMGFFTPNFYNCDLWFSRLTAPGGPSIGEDFLSPVNINFIGCRAHWSNQNGTVPHIYCADPSDFSNQSQRIIGIPLSNPGTTWETLPAAPPPRTP